MMRTVLFFILISLELSLFAQVENAVPFRDGNKWGWADVHTGKIMIEPVYDSVKYEREYSTLESGNRRFVYKDGKKGMIGYLKDSNNCIVKVPPLYDYFTEMDETENLYITYLNDKKGVYQAGYGEIVENKYKYIDKKGDFLFLYDFPPLAGSKYNSGLFSLVTKKIIDSLVYRILTFNENFWTETFKSEKDILLENTLLEDKNGKYYYLARDMTLKEVIIGLDFRFPKPPTHPPYPIERLSEVSIFEVRYNCYSMSHSKTRPHNIIIASSRTKYEKEFTKVKGKRYLKIGRKYNDNQIIGNRKGKKFGILNTSNNSILFAPEYDSISMFAPEKHFRANIMIGYKKNTQTLIVNNNKVYESGYEFVFCANELNYKFNYIRISNGKLLGFVNLDNLDNRNNSFDWKLIEPKYKDLKISWLCVWATGVLVFEATDTNGETFFVNKDGIEFKR